MVFVDGENLAIRYKGILGENDPFGHVQYEPDVFVWSKFLNMHHHLHCEVIRRYYYTSTRGDEQRREEIHDRLQKVGIEAPRVFPRRKKSGSKRVDISLAVDMLSHAYLGNYDIAVLVAGDEDYVPLVDAVGAAGRRVFLWFIEDGLSPSLRRKVDYYFDIGRILLNGNPDRHFSV
jgi:uncharacterized LabA/DUF88 family protein